MMSIMQRKIIRILKYERMLRYHLVLKLSFMLNICCYEINIQILILSYVEYV